MIEELEKEVDELLRLCENFRYSRKKLYLDIGELMFRIFLLRKVASPHDENDE